MLTLLVKGLIIGFSIAAPIGPIGVLCIQRSLHHGFKIGLMTGMGAALADGAYGLVAGLSLTAISSFLVQYQFWIRTIGGLFLLYLGLKLILTSPGGQIPRGYSEKSSWHACSTSFLLTLANPMTLLSFIAIFAGLGLGTAHPDPIHALLLVSGIILGSAFWWLLLSGGVVFVLHHRITPKTMRGINWISGIILLTFGILILLLTL